MIFELDHELHTIFTIFWLFPFVKIVVLTVDMRVGFFPSFEDLSQL